MTKVLITGAGSYVGESVKKYILSTSTDFEIDSVDTINDAWKKADFSQYDVVFHVAGIAHVNADPKMEPLYYKVNRDLTIEIAKHAMGIPNCRRRLDCTNWNRKVLRCAFFVHV